MTGTDIKALPAQGAGGRARAEALTPRERTKIAKRAAEARWLNLPRAERDGVLKLGSIPCYVLEDRRRVLSQGGMLQALGMKPGSNPRLGGTRLANFVLGKGIVPFVGESLAAAIKSPIRFKTQRGAVAYGYEATILVDLCKAVLQAKKENKLHFQQMHIGDRCEVLLNALAGVAIIALVDEATGYQDIRPKDALQKYLELILRKELAAWSKKFPDEFYENIYKLRGWVWPGMSKNRYSVVAKYTRDLVYERLAPSLLEELERKSPKNEKGHRKNKLHQWLTDDVGNPLLAQHLYSLMMFQRLAIQNGHGWKRFVRMVDQVLPRKGSNLELPLLNPSTEP